MKIFRFLLVLFIVLPAASGVVYANAHNKCGTEYLKFRTFFIEKEWPQIASKTYRDLILEAYKDEIEVRKISRSRSGAYRARLQIFVDQELLAAIMKEGGLLDQVSCAYSFLNQPIDMLDLKEILENASKSASLGTQNMQWVSSLWCAKEFWPKFYEEYYAKKPLLEPIISFRPYLWCHA